MPRYAGQITVASEDFSEPEYPKTVKTEKFVSDDVLREVVNRIKENL
jgi:hypothetical protein